MSLPGERMKGPAYRIRTRRLLLRCWNPSDAALLKAAVDESLDHLRPWLAWAKDEPEGLEAKVERLRAARGSFDLDQDYTYGIFSPDETKVLGAIGLHTRAGEGEGLATEAAAAVAKVAFESHEVDRVEIHCSPANVASAAIPRKLGFTHEATLRQRVPASDGAKRDVMIWTMLRDEYAKGALLAVAEVEAFDATDRRLSPE